MANNDSVSVQPGILFPCHLSNSTPAQVPSPMVANIWKPMPEKRAKLLVGLGFLGAESSDSWLVAGIVFNFCRKYTYIIRTPICTK